MSEGPEGIDPLPSAEGAGEIRERLAADIAAGRTVILGQKDLAHPDLREKLPVLLEELRRAAPAESAATPTVPGYTLLGEIGQGGMSTVFLARHDKLGRYVALKIAPNWLGGQKRARERLLAEAQAMARLSHPHIVAIHDIIEHGDSFVLAMEWVDGLSLSALLRQLGDEPPEDGERIRRILGAPDTPSPRFAGSTLQFFVRTIRDVARAVHRVHESGLLHLDIKPSNVLLRRDGTALLADFGVVREITADVTSPRSFAGTPMYAAPEQMRRDDRQFGAHTDVYGLGMTLYEALARRAPIDREDITRLYRDLAAGRVPRLSTQIDVARDLEVIVHRAIDPEPKQRYASAEAFADDLQAFLEHRPIAARAPTRREALRRWARAEPWRAALAVALLVLVPVMLGLGIYLYGEMPRIAAARAAEQRRMVVHKRHLAAQNFLLSLATTGDGLQQLRDAIALDPSAESLAYFAGLVLLEDRDAVRDELARHPEALASSLALRCQLDVAEHHRPCMSDQQIAELSASLDQVDQIALALDRLAMAEQIPTEANYLAARKQLDEAAASMSTPDMLLMGLSAYASSMAADADKFAITARALRRQAPDDLDGMVWLAMLTERVDRQAALAANDALIARAPDDVRCWECLIGMARRNLQPQRALDLLQAAERRGIRHPILDAACVRTLHNAHRTDEAKAIAARIPLEQLPPTNRLVLLGAIDPARATADCRQLLEQPKITPGILRTILDLAIQRSDLDLGQRTIARSRQEYPADRSLKGAEIFFYGVVARDAQKAHEATKHFELPRYGGDDYARLVLPILTTQHDWERLLEVSDRGMAVCASAKLVATFYHGLALARLGHHDQAAKAIQQSISQDVDLKSRDWQRWAMLELAWLYASPDVPSALHDPKRAMACLKEFLDTGKDLPAGPWSHRIAAAVYFANGEAEQATREAAAGLRQRRVWDNGPSDTLERLGEELARYRGK